MQSRSVNPARLGVFWFGIQLVWGALLGVSLQARTTELAGANALSAFGLIASLGPVVAALSQIGAGMLSDKRRAAGSTRVEFYYAGAAVAAVGLMWFYEARSFAQLVGAVLLVQLAMNVAIAAYQAAIPDTVPSDRAGGASGWMAAQQSLGNAAGAVLASFVPSPFALGAIIAGALLACALATGTHVARFTLGAVPSQPLRMTRALWDLLISRGLLFLGFYTLLDYLFFYVSQTVGASSAKTITGIVLLTFTVAGAIGAAFAARPADRRDTRHIAIVGAAGFACVLVAFVFAKSLAVVLACGALGGVAWGVFLTADWAIGCVLVPQQALATAMAVWNLALILPQVVAPALTTGILRTFGLLHSPEATHAAFLVATLEVIAGGLWLLRLPAFLRECSS